MYMSNSKEIMIKVTDGLLRTATNGILWWLFLTGAGFGKSKTSYGAYLMFREADEALRDFNYDLFKQFLAKLRREGLINQKRQYSQIEIEITARGKERIQSLFPIYRTERPWDGFLYLISYDVPEEERISRDTLRRYLKRIGCGLLQESLWITPFSPRKLLNEFMSDRHIQGTVLVSKLGKDGAIGEEKLCDLLERVYHLRDINRRYAEFISHTKRRTCPFKLAIEFQYVVSDDPQLPFALLPKTWKGHDAYAAYQALYK